MPVRKNAKFLTAAEIESFVRACVLMKADIVNPAAPANDQYSRWDEYVAIHQMIQNAFAPGAASVNFGHGGNLAFSFLSWHRYFLYRLELELQAHVPGVMLPYWDWTDPASIMTETFLGPDGGAGDVVQLGYFAFDRPGVGANTTALPAWWPVALVGWRLPAAFGTWEGGLRRSLDAPSDLPSPDDIREALQMATYSTFQNALESGSGISSGHDMHNRMHTWIGGHMGNPAASPFDPIFYLHHCNIDRLWAMWQMDGHADEYPAAGGDPHHLRTDLMYPWTGGAAGYGTNAAIASSIPMPDFSGLGAQTNEDTLDFRTAYEYTYDTLAIIGVGLDRTGSMLGLTPDPMTSGAPDVTKWEAAKRGVSAFLQDCETVQDSGVTYVHCGIKTFRRLLANDFTNVFPAPGYGLVKNGGAFSQAAFDAAAGAMSPSGSTPLADALLDVQNTIVEPPFAGLPTDERRYLAMLTDGLLTSGAPLGSIGDGSLTRTAIFAMGFGTAADVDYATLADVVAKGQTLTTTQIFHGENAGTIDKFYSNALAASIGFTTLFDPVVELFAGEHSHIDFHATSADDVFMITAQGMDFDDDNWTFHLHGPGDTLLYGDGTMHRRHEGQHACHECCPVPTVSARRANGRLTLVVQRGNTEAACWVGRWRLMVAFKARRFDAMVMPEIGEWLFPVSAGPVRGARYTRLLQQPAQRRAKRNSSRRALHPLDVISVGTNRNDRDACDCLVNIYARTGLRTHLVAPNALLALGQELNIEVRNEVLRGSVVPSRSFARLVGPSVDIKALVGSVKRSDIPEQAALRGSTSLKFDSAKILAALERRNPNLANLRDRAIRVVSHHGGPLHIHDQQTTIRGVYHLGVYVEGTYYPHGATSSHGHQAHRSGSHGAVAGEGEYFNRLLNVAIAVDTPTERATRPKAVKGRGAKAAQRKK
jgi:hypothetical protein